MTRAVRIERLWALPVAVLLLTLAAACDLDGGEATPSPVATPTAPPTAAASPTPTATATPLVTVTPSPSPATPAASPTPSPTPSATAFGRLKNLSSYRYTMRWEIAGVKTALIERLGRLAENPNALPDPFVVDAKGTAIGPDKLETVYAISGVEGEFAIVVINREQWLKLPGGTVVGPTAFQGSLDDINEAAGFWDSKVVRSAPPLSCAGEKEMVNGIPTRHCQITRATIQQLTALFGVSFDQGRIASSSLDLWLHESEGFPLRVRIALQGVDEKGKEFRVKLDMDITDVNNLTLQVQPPT